MLPLNEELIAIAGSENWLFDKAVRSEELTSPCRDQRE